MKLRPVTRTGSTLLLSVALIAGVFASSPIPAEASDTSTRWETFSESTSCGESATPTPFVSREGYLSDSEPILGPFGTYFGRTIGEVQAQLVWWTVPDGGGRRVKVHRAMLASLQKLEAILAEEAANGRVYRVTSAGGFIARTIGGSHQVSRHGLGLSIDINPPQNPYSAHNLLITNMPIWYVNAWRSAGFCWGGDWKYIKDPMHFSWMGPGAAGSPASVLPPRPPATSLAPFGGPAASHTTPFAPVMPRYKLNIADASGNGAPDVVGLRSHPDGSVIDVARAVGGYGECSIARWFVPDTAMAGADHVVFGDVDGDSGQDLIALSASGGSLSATVATRRAEYKDPQTWATGLDIGAIAVTAADFDLDHRADLWEATADGRLRVWRGPSWTELISDQPLPGGVPSLISAGDRDGGNTPELFALYPTGAVSRIDVFTYASGWVSQDSIPLTATADSVAAIGAGDYDGDGRSDVQILSDSGTLTAHIGNTSTGIPASRWFLHPEWECEDDDVPLVFNGVFFDDEFSQFQSNIDAIAAVEITRGCNPPFGDMFCPDGYVTRGAMAAFLVRALGLETNTHPGFIDVPWGSVFAEDIGRLATAGITLGCNPTGDRFCPDDLVTRETMAAFLVRGLGLQANTHPGFIDVAPDSIFIEDIGRLATAGVTLGCTVSGDAYCPTEPVTREAMAAFLDRAGLGGG